MTGSIPCPAKVAAFADERVSALTCIPSERQIAATRRGSEQLPVVVFMSKASEKSVAPAVQLSSPSAAEVFFFATPTEKMPGIAELETLLANQNERSAHLTAELYRYQEQLGRGDHWSAPR